MYKKNYLVLINTESNYIQSMFATWEPTYVDVFVMSKSLTGYR